jgi:hypothetical protein
LKQAISGAENNVHLLDKVKQPQRALAAFLKSGCAAFSGNRNRKRGPVRAARARSASSGSYGPDDLMNIEDCQNENSRP